MKYKQYIAGFAACMFLLAACKEEKMGPMGGSEVPPAPIKKVEVQNLPGGAKISYTLPSSLDLLYIKAVYSIRNGVEREAKASYYDNFVVVDGFNDTVEHKVKLYAVNRKEKVSEPFEVMIKPLIPPVKVTFASLQMQETFGGAYVAFENPTEADLAIVLMTEDSTGELVTAETYYTKSLKGNFSARGFESKERLFAVYVKDKWGNISDTLKGKFTPIYEILIPKPFKEINLPTDTWLPHTANTSWKMPLIWNGTTNSANDVFHTKPGSGIPQWFTFALSSDNSKQFLLSRFKWFHRKDYAYVTADPQNWEVWGSTNPNMDGSWNSWFKLMDCESTKPSGIGTPVTTEDKNFAVIEGEDFTFPLGLPPVKYLRIKVTRTWGMLDYMHIAEVTFWGQQVP